MRNISFVILFALILISSCQSEDSPKVKPTVYSKTGNEKIIKISLPNDVLPSSAFTRIHTNEAKEELLYYYNSPGSEILIFNIHTTELKKRIKLDRDGPDGIGACRGFSIIDDNNLVVSGLNSELFFVNHSGEIVNKINYEIESSLHFPVALDLKDVYFIENETMIIPHDVTARNSDMILLKNEQKANTSIFSTYNDGKINPLEIYVPTRENEVNHPNHPWNMSTVFHDNTLYWTFSTSKNIYYSTDLKNIQEAVFDPPSLPQANGIDPFAMGPYLTFVKTTRFGKLMRSDNNFYQMVRHGVNKDEMAGLSDKHISRFPNKFSILVFDEQLNFEKEVMFRGTYYHYGMCFTSSDGVYLSLNNPLNPDYDENYLRFMLLDI